MTDRSDNSLLLFLAGIPVALITALLGAVLALIGGVCLYFLTREIPATAIAAPNHEEQRYEVEVTNPASRAYRVTAVSFQIREMIPPPLPKGAIEIETVYFTPEDYNAATNTYRKDLFGVEMPANGNVNFRLLIIDPRYAGYIFRGALTYFYGDRESPRTMVIDDYGVIVKASS